MIQFAINKAYFLQALHTTRRAISSKNAIPILSTIKINIMLVVVGLVDIVHKYLNHSFIKI